MVICHYNKSCSGIKTYYCKLQTKTKSNLETEATQVIWTNRIWYKELFTRYSVVNHWKGKKITFKVSKRQQLSKVTITLSRGSLEEESHGIALRLPRRWYCLTATGGSEFEMGCLWAWDPDLEVRGGQPILMSMWGTGVCKYEEN